MNMLGYIDWKQITRRGQSEEGRTNKKKLQVKRSRGQARNNKEAGSSKARSVLLMFAGRIDGPVVEKARKTKWV